MRVLDTGSGRFFLFLGVLIPFVVTGCSTGTGSSETAGSGGNTAALAFTTSPPSPPPSPPPPPLPAPTGEVRFLDHFEGTTLDTGNWNASIATSGVRWVMPLSTTSVPGNWQDVSLVPYQGFIQAPPYGSLLVTGSLVRFSAGVSRAFPYIWAGPPSRPLPIPATGDFVFDLVMKWDSVARQGPWVMLLDWPNSDPVGDNNPAEEGKAAFSLMACSSRGFRFFPAGATWSNANGEMGIDLSPLGTFLFHHYRVEYVRGRYSYFVDGVLRYGPVASTLRPTTLWIGGPGFVSWELSDNSDFSIDSIRVTVPDPGSSVEVAIDVKPGSHPDSPINLGSRGTLPVAILGASDFDVSFVDPATVELAGARVRKTPKGDIRTSVEDVNGDGLADLVLHLETEDLLLDEGATEVILTGSTFDGRAIQGRDTIRIVPPVR